MKKPLLFTVCFVLAFSTLRAQEPDPMMQEITTSVSIPVQISNGRQMFLKELLAGNEQKAVEVRDYLKSRVQDTPYLAFTGTEYLLSMYWTRDYGGLLANTALADSLFSMPRDIKISPPYDELAMKLLRMSTDSLTMLEERIDGAMLNLEERDYLKIVLGWLVAGDYDFETLRQVSDEARAYLADYPHSPHKSFLNNFLIYNFKESKWGYGFFIGMGTVFPGGQTKNCFNTPGFGLSMGFDALYRNLYMGTGLVLAGSGLDRDIAFKGHDFTPEDRMTVVGIDLRAGYKVLDTRRLALVPYAAIGGAGLSMIRNGDSDYEQYNSAVTYGGGAFLDIKFSSTSSAEYLLTGRASSYGSVRLRYHISSADYRLPETGNTLIHWLTIELGGLSRRIHRVRQ